MLARERAIRGDDGAGLMPQCFKCQRQATWEFLTTLPDAPAGLVGLRAFCDECASLTRDMIEDVYQHDPGSRRRMLNRLQPLVMH